MRASHTDDHQHLPRASAAKMMRHVSTSRLCGCICELSRRLAIRHLAHTVKVSSLDGLALFFSRRPQQWRFYAGAVGGVAQAPKLWLGPPKFSRALDTCSIDSQKKIENLMSSDLIFSRPRSEGWPHHGRTFSIYPCHLLIDSSAESPVHVLMLSIQAVRRLPRLCAPGIVPCIISFSRQPP